MVMDRRHGTKYSRPDEWLRELRKDADDGVVFRNLARIAIVHTQATEKDFKPWMAGSPQGEQPREPWFTVRWIRCAYIAEGELIHHSLNCGLECDMTEAVKYNSGWKRYSADALEAARAKWRQINRETEDVELGMSRQLSEAVQAMGIEVRSGNMGGFDPNWEPASVNEIAAPAPSTSCATCGQPIYFSNELWRHRETTAEPYVAALIDDTFGEITTRAGREEAFIEYPCSRCKGTTKVPFAKGTGMQRCDACLLTPGKASRLHHLADPEVAERKV